MENGTLVMETQRVKITFFPPFLLTFRWFQLAPSPNPRWKIAPNPVRIRNDAGAMQDTVLEITRLLFPSREEMEGFRRDGDFWGFWVRRGRK